MSLFQMSVAGGVLILFIVVIRALAIHRLPKTTFLALWMIAALRLLLPFSIPLPFNIHIGLDVFSDVVQELPSGNIASTLPGDSPPSYDIGTLYRRRFYHLMLLVRLLQVLQQNTFLPLRYSGWLACCCWQSTSPYPIFGVCGSSECLSPTTRRISKIG